MNSFEITVQGKVQGIGYIPFVAKFAEENGYKGAVRYCGGAVKVHVVCEPDDVGKLTYYLRYSCPEGGRIDNIVVKPLKRNLPAESFQIIDSDNPEGDVRFLPADKAICEDCKAELRGKRNRRYRYAFISCNKCGPRYSVMKSSPFDRKNSSMSGFAMCPDCQREYINMDQDNIRSYDQLLGCKDCGPQLKFYVNRLSALYGLSQDEIIDKTIQFLETGKIGAVKDLGGFSFICRPDKADTVKRLRNIKNRNTMGLAMVFPNMETIKKYCVVSEEEESLLTSQAGPIVLLERKADAPDGICEEAFGFSDRIGAALPFTGLQVILTDALGPLVMTAGRKEEGHLIIDDEDMMSFLSDDGLSDFIDEEADEKESLTDTVDFMLTNNREIFVPMERSVIQTVEEKGKGRKINRRIQFIRRSLGYVPEAIEIENRLPNVCFAAGGDLKSVFAIGKDQNVFLSEEIENLSDETAAEERETAVQRFENIMGLKADEYIADMHEEYISTADTLKRSDNISRVQHHFAHVLSVVAENHIQGKVVGLVFDSTGYGTDETVWGGEIFSCNIPKIENPDSEEKPKLKMDRAASLLPVKMLGGDISDRDAVSTLCCYLRSAEDRQLIGINAFDNILKKTGIDRNDYGVICACLRANISTYRSSSMGRLFDAVAAMLGICSENTYEGECSIMLEQYAGKYITRMENGELDFDDKDTFSGKFKEILEFKVDIPRTEEEVYRIDQTLFISDLAAKYLAMLSEENADIELIRERLAYEFHMAVVNISADLLDSICSRDYVNHIALSGGLMNNRILCGYIIGAMDDMGYRVYTNSKVPSMDGGIALGQIFGLTYEDESSAEPQVVKE